MASEIDQETGLLLVSIEAGSPADAASLVMGDTIIGFDNQPIRHFDDLLSLLNSADIVGKEVSLRILRAGEVKTAGLTVGEQD
jgi:S1-C subfamily serine protease